MNTKCIVYCVNENIQLCKYLFNSVTTLLNNNEYDIYIMTYKYQEVNSFFNETSIFNKLKIIDISDQFNLYFDSSLNYNSVIHYSAFLKLFIPLCDVLSSYEKILYIDNDTEIISSLDDVFNNDYNGYFFGCIKLKNCIDGKYGSILFHDKIRKNNPFIRYRCFRRINDRYVNTGVMLFNNVLIRKEKEFYTKTLLKSIDEYNKNSAYFPYPEEVAVNIFFSDRIKDIDYCYNKAYYEGIMNDKNIKIVHYCGSSKKFLDKLVGDNLK